MIQHGDVVEIDKENGELNVKDVLGEQLGSFRQSSVIGWWIDREPLDMHDLSAKDLERLIAEMVKRGMVTPEQIQEIESQSST